MDYQRRIELLKAELNEYRASLNMACIDRAKWHAFDEKENEDADYGGTPGAIVNALDEFIDKTIAKIRECGREIVACQDYLAGRIDEVEI